MQFNKRKFLILSSLAFGAPSVFATPVRSDTMNEINDDGVSFIWQHNEGRFFGELSAPTTGWIAVGFNANPGIAGTYFLMASVAGDVPRIEERYALAPQHVPIRDVGWTETVELLSGGFQNGASSVAFSVASTLPDEDRISLQPPRDVHLMLAWSHAADFDHHSAWRKHYQISL